MFVRLIWLSVTLIVGVMSSGFAQLAVGAKAGVQVNTSDFKNAGQLPVPFNAGAFVKYKAASFVDVRAEGVYSQLGGNYNGYYESSPSVFHANPFLVYHAVELPFLLDFTLPSLTDGKIFPSIFCGASYSFAFAADEHFDEQYIIRGHRIEGGRFKRDLTTISDEHNFAWIVGFGMHSKVFEKPVMVDLRYRRNIGTNLTPSGEVQFSTLSLNVAVEIVSFF